MIDARIQRLAQAIEKGAPCPPIGGEGLALAPDGAGGRRLPTRLPREDAPRDRGGPGDAEREPAGPIARASVALLVRPAPADLELFVIKRATRSGDPWSGHMAFPGGKRDPHDHSARETAERETHEEIGIDLRKIGRFLGPLAEVWPRSGAPAIVVSPFVFSVPVEAALHLNEEVAAAFWIPLHRLGAPGAATEYLHALASGEELRFPAIAYESHVIWGLTHRIMTEFLEIVRAITTRDPGARQTIHNR